MVLRGLFKAAETAAAMEGAGAALRPEIQSGLGAVPCTRVGAPKPAYPFGSGVGLGLGLLAKRIRLTFFPRGPVGGGGATAGAGTATVHGGVGSHVDDVDEGPLGKPIVTWTEGILAWIASKEPFSVISLCRLWGCWILIDELLST